MCGIYGITAVPNTNIVPWGMAGIRRLEYRGYDSAGFALQNSAELTIIRSVGDINALRDAVSGHTLVSSVGIWHTRWATHGAPSERNTHPHTGCDTRFAVVHNGTIENHDALRRVLTAAGHRFTSETDTEVVAHLLEMEYRGNLAEAMRAAIHQIEGTFALVAITADEPGVIVASRRSSPLAIGILPDARLIASDAAAMAIHTREVVHLEDYDIATLSPTSHMIVDAGAVTRMRPSQAIELEAESAEFGGFPHRMLFEINEQPAALSNSLRGRIIAREGHVRFGGLAAVEKQLSAIEDLTVVGCGTAYHAALIGAMYIEAYAGLSATAVLASEYEYRRTSSRRNSAMLAISQSGETMDTLLAIKGGKDRGILTLGIVNRVGSAIARLTDAGIYNHIGPETSVASTKAFVSQVTLLALLAIHLGRQRDLIRTDAERMLEAVLRLPDKITTALAQSDHVRAVAEQFGWMQSCLFIGRGYQYPVALEGALKLKEVSYAHAEGYSAGEMKHGPLALVDDRFPTIAIAVRDSRRKKMVANIQEIKARRGPVIAIANPDDSEIASLADATITVPEDDEFLMPVLTAIPLQLFAYWMGVSRGINVDKPRNLAKSVTTE
ncbi:glutamine--fructose-6-phosphate transaminase (isomerizing) [Candidatus Parcubacteria bacterium]|nr:MAG: glutamine--fructose-6-phosphate transaminase (isomerizing) [Candidatus Parcubacteria bacterium]